MLPFGVTIPPTVPQRSEIPEGIMNYPVHVMKFGVDEGYPYVIQVRVQTGKHI